MRDRGWRDDALFVALAYGFSWVFLLLPLQGGARTTCVTLATFAPTFAALVLAARQGGRKHVVAQLKRFVTFRAPFGGYLLAWYLFPSLLVLTFLAFGFRAANASVDDVFIGIVAAAPLNYTLGVLTFGSVGPQGEELGWRGYLLPRWRERWGEHRAPLLLGVVWCGWHLPLFFDPSWGPANLPFVAAFSLYFVSVVASSYALAYVSWIARDNLVVCILMHGAINLSFNMLGSFAGPFHDDGVMNLVVLDIAAVGSALVAGLLWRWVKTRRAKHAAAASAQTQPTSANLPETGSSDATGA